jgi:exosortase family protein XrtF
MNFKDLVQSNKAVIKFLIVFFGSYLVLASLYQAFLKYNPFENYYPDIITHAVAYQSYYFLDFLGYTTSIYKDADSPSMLIAINNVAVTRVIEGCNSISVIILFASFIIAFSRGLKSTLLFILLGSITIYVLNVVRVSLLTVGLYFYSEYNSLMHDILFPLFIYGVVFLLWLYWISNFKKHQTA